MTGSVSTHTSAGDADSVETEAIHSLIAAFEEADTEAVDELLADEPRYGLSATDLVEAWATTTSLMGALESVDLNESSRENTESATLRFEETAATLEVVFTDDGQIEYLEIEQDAGTLETIRLVLRSVGFRLRQRLSGFLGGGDTVLYPPSSPAERIEFAKTVLDRYDDGEFEVVWRHLAPETRAKLTPDELRIGWQDTVHSLDRIVDQQYDSDLDQVEITFESPNGMFTLEAQFEENGLLSTFFIRDAIGETDTYSPPAYVDPSTFEEERITFDGRAGEVDARLCIPTGIEPDAGVVIVHGSGSFDRDGTVGAIKPYRDIAHGLATDGIAVLRYEKRAPDDMAENDLDGRVLHDAAAAIDRLHDAAELDLDRVFIVGHSLGGYLAPRLASEDARVDGIIALNAPSRPVHEVAADQIQYLRSRHGTPTPEDERDIQQMRNLPETLRNEDLPADERLNGFPVSFWRDLVAYDLESTVAGLDIPICAVFGEADWRLTDGDQAAWCDHPESTVQVYPELDHFLMPAADPDDPIPGREALNVSSKPLSDIAARIADQ